MLDVRADQDLFRVSREQRGHTVQICVGGELDMETSPVLEATLLEAEDSGNSAIVVDLEKVTFMDASGLRSFLRAAERARLGGHTFAVIKAPAVVQRVFRITQTTPILKGMPE